MGTTKIRERIKNPVGRPRKPKMQFREVDAYVNDDIEAQRLTVSTYGFIAFVVGALTIFLFLGIGYIMTGDGDLTGNLLGSLVSAILLCIFVYALYEGRLKLTKKSKLTQEYTKHE